VPVRAVCHPHLTLLQPLQDQFLPLALVVLVAAECGCAYGKVLQQLASVAGVLGQDQVYILQDTDGPEAHVFKVAYRGALRMAPDC
jgi:hypothetical protein